jgi:hypothetical protein
MSPCGAAFPGRGPAFQRVQPAKSRLAGKIAKCRKHLVQRLSKAVR